MKHILVAAAMAASVVSFASAQAHADPISDFNHFLTSAATFTEADASAALADANARNDMPAAHCYAGILDYVQAHPIALPSIPVPVGAITTFQTSRDAVKDVQAQAGTNLVPDQINAACGWLALDVQADVAKAGVKGGLTILGIKL